LTRVKTPTLLQMEATECGAASLGIILGYYGKIIPLEELRITAGISRDGSKASNVIKAAAQYDLAGKGFKVEIEDLSKFKPPYIVFWQFNHFLVVEGFKKDIVYLNDPAVGPRTVSKKEFDESFTGVILTFEPNSTFQKSGKKQNLFLKLYNRFKGSESNLVYIMIATLALTIPGLVIPVFSQWFVDDYLIKKISGMIFPLLIGMLITAALRASLTWLQQNQLLKLQFKLMLINSSKFFWHVLRLPLAFYQQRYAGDIAQRVESNSRVAALITGQLATNFVNIISIIFYAALMFWYDVVLTLIGIGIASTNFFVLRYIAQKRKDQSLKLLQDRGKLMAITMGGLSIIETIKATGGENDYFVRWAGYRARVTNSEQKLEVSTRFLGVMPAFLLSLMMVIILGVGGYRVMHGDLTIGMLVAFQSLMLSFNAPLANLVGLGSSLQNIEGDITRLDDVLKATIDPLLENTKPTTKIEKPKLAGFLELRNITFGYNTLEPPLIENFNLSLKPGERVALVGSTGSGKTTIARLITGINQPWSGEILFDGKPREQIPREVLVNSLAAVDQDIFLFDASVHDNLTLWDDTRSEIDIIEGAKAADIHSIILARPKGYDSRVAEQGSNFSGGERQRLEIARAIGMKPSLLVMDEATASLDPLTEKLIDDNIRKLGITCMLVAHRLSTIRDCEEIIVMQKGKIVQRGTHETLLAQGGLYAQLIQLEEKT
jgi:NHLM bacteriocin system ABC transporter peptidase/ATP-binding protein